MPKLSRPARALDQQPTVREAIVVLPEEFEIPDNVEVLPDDQTPGDLPDTHRYYGHGVYSWRSALHNAGWTRGGDGGTSIGIRIPNRIKLNVLNKLTEIRIPDNDLRRLYSELGVPSQEPVLNGTRYVRYLTKERKYGHMVFQIFHLSEQ